MPISTTCPNCSVLFRLGDDLAGKTVKCQACASMFVVPTGDKAGTLPGILVSIGAPPVPAPVPPSSEGTPVFPAPPPMPRPVVLKAADEESVQDETPPRSERLEPRRRSRERAPVKSRSSALPWVLGLGAVGLVVCLGCTGVSAIWFVGTQRVQNRAKKIDVVKQMEVAKKFEGFKDKGFPRPDVLQKFDDLNNGMNPPPQPAPPGGFPVVFGPDGVFRSDNGLTQLDPVKQNKFQKIYMVQMKKGKTYEIDMISNQIDSYLFLVDDKNQVVALDDDSGGGLNALIIHDAQRDGAFRIEATSFGQQQIGNFSLIVKER